jgi:glucosylglycerol-phosphate synthase
MEGWSDSSRHSPHSPLGRPQVKNFYYITAKEAFWPILHSFPEHFTYESSDWENFKAH